TIDYRRAPKHRFPAGFDDAALGLEWVLQEITAFGGDRERVCLLGDSAGGNIAAGLATTTDHRAAVRAAAFLYAIFDFRTALPIVGRIMGTTPQTQVYLPVEQFDQLTADPRVSPIVG